MAGSEHDEEHPLQRRRFALLRREWQLSLYPQAAEAGGCLVTLRSGEGVGRGSDPERSQAEAARRARSKIRRYGVANRLNRFGTLTYSGEGCFDPVQLRQDAAFFKGLRPALGGQAFPYVWVPEWHPGGHGLRVHFVVGRYVRQRLIRETWGHGIVHIKLIGDLPVGSGVLAEARRAAGYLCKYIGKGFDDERHRSGMHRYEVARPSRLAERHDKEPSRLAPRRTRALDEPVVRLGTWTKHVRRRGPDRLHLSAHRVRPPRPRETLLSVAELRALRIV